MLCVIVYLLVFRLHGLIYDCNTCSTQLAKASIDSKFADLTADAARIILFKEKNEGEVVSDPLTPLWAVGGCDGFGCG